MEDILTPGPWEWLISEDFKVATLIGDYDCIMRIDTNSEYGELPGRKDSDLMEAAPDLLEACRASLDDIMEWGGPKGRAEQLEAAIAKAEGRDA